MIMDRLCVCLIMQKELQDALRSLWFQLLAVMFTGLALLLTALGASALGALGGAGFGRTTVSLLNLVILTVPLMGLLTSIMSVSGEREHGTLMTILAQPVVLEEVFLGKYLGLAGALLGTLLLGFGLAALTIIGQCGLPQMGSYVTLVANTALFALGYISLGFLISALTRRAASAVGVGLFAWLTCVFLSDLGLIGTALALRLSPRSLFWLSLANPAQVLKVAVLGGIQRNLESLGPAGTYVAEVFGTALQPALTAILSLWAVLPFALSILLLRKRGVA
jgi:Cu-processing system permease protein